MTQQTSDWAKLDDELIAALKKLVRTHHIPLDPKFADYDTISDGLWGPHRGLSGEEANRYKSISNDSYWLHDELTHLRRGGAQSASTVDLELEVRKLIDRTLRLSDEDPPIQQPSEPIIRLVMYLLPLSTSLAGLTLVVYFPSSLVAVGVGVGITDLGFVGWAWAWRVRFVKYAGPRQMWVFASIYVIGLNIAVILRLLGVVRTPIV